MIESFKKQIYFNERLPVSITTKLLLFTIALFEFSPPELTDFSSCLSIISLRTLSRLCLSLTNSANRLVSGILLLISNFLVGGVGERVDFDGDSFLFRLERDEKYAGEPTDRNALGL